MGSRHVVAPASLRSPYASREAWLADTAPAPRLVERRLTGPLQPVGWWPPTLCVVAGGRVQIVAPRFTVPLLTGALWASDGGRLHRMQTGSNSPAHVRLILAPAAALTDDETNARRWRVEAPLWFDLLLQPDAQVSRLARAAALDLRERQDASATPDSFALLLDELRLRQGEIIGRLPNCPGRNDRHRLQVLARVQRVRALLDANFRGELSLQDMAALAELSRVHFLRTFHQVYGVTPFQYLDRRRSNLVSELLADGRLSSTEIAQAYGFASRSSFARWFRLRTGCSPEEFRRVMQAGRELRERVDVPIDRLLGRWGAYFDPAWRTDRRRRAIRSRC